MNKADVVELFKAIKYLYTAFPVPTEQEKLKQMVEAWHEALRSVPFEQARENLARYALTNEYPPTVSALVKSLEPERESAYHGRLRGAAEEHSVALDDMKREAVPPPSSIREKVKSFAIS